MTDNDAAAFAAGIYQDVPELDYHSGRFGPHGSVSSTEAKRLLECPALYKWSKEHPTPPKAAFDFGHTVHGMVLGTGLDIYVHDHDSLRTKAAKEDIAAARERGQVPMSRADYARAEDAYQAVMNHPAAAVDRQKAEALHAILASRAAVHVINQERETMTRIIDEICRVANIADAHDALARRIAKLEN